MSRDLSQFDPLDPFGPHAFYAAQDASRARLAALKGTATSPVCWLLGNGPSLLRLLGPINASPLPKIGTNKALGAVWPLTYHVIAHQEHLSEPVPGFLGAEATGARFASLEREGRLLVHGDLGERGLSIPISHASLFSTDLSAGASEGTAATGGSVLLVAMQLAYHLGHRTFLLAGCECQGGKFYAPERSAPAVQARMLDLWRLVAPLLAPLGVSAYLVEPGEGAAATAVWPTMPLADALAIGG